MGIVNMIYIATLSDRVPIVPPFAPNDHVPNSSGVIYFGDIFNLTHLQATIQTPILEWRQVKEPPPDSSTNREQLGCWSTRNIDETKPYIAENMLNHLGLDVSYTRVPDEVRTKKNLKEVHVIFSELAALAYPEHPSVNVLNLPLMYPSPMDSKLVPDQHLACFDSLYYVTSARTFEWEYPWSPAWNIIGKNLPFTERVVTMAKNYLTMAFEVDRIPPFIAVHVRRGELSKPCTDKPGECLPPLSAYAQQVQVVQEELRRKQGLDVHEVLITSDEKDPEFWAQAKSLGWRQFDHDVRETESKLGGWYPTVIDVATQSMAVGFVGTKESVFSMVSRRRVEEWNHGVIRSIRIGMQW
ncbi:hypothetical protein BDQ17DRAFT_1311884 [Cyathus striatus]|nr:hypothetical protein BDQ17DRAFT_1311884 [Cyathus striatus]